MYNIFLPLATHESIVNHFFAESTLFIFNGCIDNKGKNHPFVGFSDHNPLN